MAATPPQKYDFNSDVAALIAEIESCLNAARQPQDRETQLQREAFQERSRQAQSLARRLASGGERAWSLLSGDAHRIQQSLRYSLDYFRSHRRN